MLYVITLIGSFPLLLFGSLAFYQGAFFLGSFDIAFALAFILNIIDARTRRSYQFSIVVRIDIASCLYIVLYMNEGINQTALVWYFTFQLMASFLLVSKKGLIAMLLMTSLNQELLDEIDQHVRSATNLTNQLLGAARGGKYDPRPTDLHELIESSAVIFDRTRKELTIHTHHSAAKIVALVDRSQIEQVLLNLYVNAWQAMPSGGILNIENSIVNLDREYSIIHMVETGPFAKISVTDTGVGMYEKTQQQIFDPFFTTKEKGRGTGLGLASAYGRIKNHFGFIKVKSEPGLGTTFTFFLPLSEKEPLRENPTESTVVQGSENILLVDDEKIIIDVGNAMLQALAYSVICTH